MFINNIDFSFSDINLPKEIPCIDMPGVTAKPNEGTISQSKILLPKICELLGSIPNNDKAVITVSGGSGVGKSTISAILSYVLNKAGIGTYVMSGDNYPLRIPGENDAERLRIFRQGGIKGLRDADMLDDEITKGIISLQRANEDADLKNLEKFSWFSCYLKNATRALSEYLGSPSELDFSEVCNIIENFKKGTDYVWFKKLGRTNDSLYYEKTDMRNIKILILEWTHANSIFVKGSDIPVLLKSTPEETLKYRMERGRDAGVDSPFTTLVLGIEQKMLDSSAPFAKLILTKSGKLIDYENYASAD